MEKKIVKDINFFQTKKKGGNIALNDVRISKKMKNKR